MAQRNYLINTTALSLTASGTTIGSSNTTSATFVVARTLVRTGLGAGELLSGSQTWSIHYVVSAMTTPYEMQLKLQRLNSGGTVQATIGPGAVRSATGTYDDDIIGDLGTWAADDQLALVWEHRRPSGTGAKNGTIDANGASYIDAPAPADPNITLALTGVSSTTSVGSLSPNTSNTLTGNAAASATGQVSKVVEERFVFDTATDTNGTTLASHSPEIGGSLTLHSSFTDTMSIQSNRVGKDGATGTSAYYYSATPPNLEYTVEIDIVDVGDVNRAMGLAGWIDTATDSMIVLRRQSSTTFQLLTLVNGTPSATLASTTVTFSAGLSRRLKLKRLPGDLFEASLDGTVFGSNISITDSAFQSPGKVGYRASNIHTATGYHVDNFSAYAIAAADPNVTLALTGVSATGSVGTLATSATPLAPSALVLTALSSREVMLVWTDNANDETSFRVERKTGAGGTYAEIGSTGKNIIAFYDATVAANTTYFYRVRARNAAGDSAYLTEQSVTTPLAASTVAIVAANLQHGQGTDSQFNYQRQVDAMAGADTVCVQERSTSDTGWDTPMSNAGLTQAIFKAHTGSAGDGNAIWVRSTISVLQTYTFDMVQTSNNPTSGSPTLGWDGSTDIRRSLCAIKAQVGNKQFYVVSLHLVAASGEDSSNTNFSVQRVDQINSALGWASTTLTGGLPRIIAGDLNLPPNYPRAPERTYTADASTDVITSTAHGFTDGMAVVLRTTGTQPAPLAVGDALYAQATVYYVRDATIDTFKLAATRGGAAIDLTSNGTGSNFICATQWSLFWEAGYEDLWQEGLDNSKASAPWGDRDGNSTNDMPLHFQLTRTHDTRRIDYFMLSQSASDLTLRHVTMPDLRASCASALTSTGSFPECPEVSQLWDTPDDMGIRPSDHSFLELALDISPHVTLTLNGVSATASGGSVVGERTSGISGVSVSVSAGSVISARVVTLSGTQATIAVGTLRPESQHSLSGVLSESAVGSVTPSIAQSVVVPITTAISEAVAPAVTLSPITLAVPLVTVTTTATPPSITLALSLPVPSASVSVAVVAPSLAIGAISLTVPTITVSSQALAPIVSLGALSLSVPTASVSVTATPPIIPGGALAMPVVTVGITAATPAVSLSSVGVLVPAASLSIEATAPAVQRSLSMPVADVTTAALSPSVSLSPVTVSVPVVAVSSAAVSPDLTLGTNILSAPVASVSVSVLAPNVTNGELFVIVPAVGVDVSATAPNVTPGSVTYVVPTTENTISIVSPAVVLGARLLVAPVVTVQASVIAPTVSGSLLPITVPTVGVPVSVFAPNVTLGAVVLAVPSSGVSITVTSPAAVTSVASVTVPVASVQITVVAPFTANVGPAFSAVLSVVAKPIAEISVELKPTAVLSRWA